MDGSGTVPVWTRRRCAVVRSVLRAGEKLVEYRELTLSLSMNGLALISCRQRISASSRDRASLEISARTLNGTCASQIDVASRFREVTAW